MSESTVYAIVNRKGGVGKTTTTLNLAHGLATKLLEAVDPETNEGKAYHVNGHVLIIDLDPQGNCATALGIDPDGRCISQLITGQKTLKECVMLADRSEENGMARPNLWLLPSTTALAGAKQQIVINDVVGKLNRGNGAHTPVEEILETQLASALNVFRYIIIDCPPTLDIFSEAVYRFADGAIVPVKLDYLSTAGAAQHTLDINAAQEAGVEIEISMIVPTFMRHRERMATQMLKSLQRRYGASRVATPIPQSVKLAEAPAIGGGQTIFEYAPDSTGSTAYQELVDKIHNG